VPERFVEDWLIPLVSIFFIVDPLAAIPAFLTMTEHDTPAKRAAMAAKASIATVAILVLFASAGGLIFKFFGITLPAFRIAGGIVLGLMALDMLRAQRTTRETKEEIEEGVEKPDVAITPLAMPMLAGPGAISTVMVLMQKATPWTASFPIYTAIAVTGLATFLLLRGSELIVKLLGKTGINIMSRLMGLVLATIAVQFILTGLAEAGLTKF
jgi:multiple antibiotic resistance protein